MCPAGLSNWAGHPGPTEKVGDSGHQPGRGQQSILRSCQASSPPSRVTREYLRPEDRWVGVGAFSQPLPGSQSGHCRGRTGQICEGWLWRGKRRIQLQPQARHHFLQPRARLSIQTHQETRRVPGQETEISTPVHFPQLPADNCETGSPVFPSFRDEGHSFFHLAQQHKLTSSLLNLSPFPFDCILPHLPQTPGLNLEEHSGC